MSEQDLTPDQLEQLREQLASVSAADVVAEAAMSLIALTYVRLGIPPEQHERFRDLDQARLLVDALGGMLTAADGRLGAPEPSLRDALASLRRALARRELVAGPYVPSSLPALLAGGLEPEADAEVRRGSERLIQSLRLPVDGSTFLSEEPLDEPSGCRAGRAWTWSTHAASSLGPVTAPGT